jgi:CheY-like chemotaxis protein
MGEGTTFKIYLPRIKEGITSCSVTVRTDEMPQGKETILVVEDNDDVRGFITAVLRELGYSIFEARDGVEALSLCNERKGDFALVITDVIMPNMNGDRLASRIGELYPEIKVLYMSGYADNIITEKGILKEGINYLQKPITAMALAQEVRRVLDS